MSFKHPTSAEIELLVVERILHYSEVNGRDTDYWYPRKLDRHEAMYFDELDKVYQKRFDDYILRFIDEHTPEEIDDLRKKAELEKKELNKLTEQLPF